MQIPLLVGIPAVIALVLALLPPGPVALGGLVLGVAATVTALFWIGDNAPGLESLLPSILGMAVVVAGLIQLNRHQRKGAGRGALAVILICLAILAGLSIRTILLI